MVFSGKGSDAIARKGLFMHNRNRPLVPFRVTNMSPICHHYVTNPSLNERGNEDRVLNDRVQNNRIPRRISIEASASLLAKTKNVDGILLDWTLPYELSSPRCNVCETAYLRILDVPDVIPTVSRTPSYTLRNSLHSEQFLNLCKGHLPTALFLFRPMLPHSLNGF